jgi:hypothetical protein
MTIRLNYAGPACPHPFCGERLDPDRRVTGIVVCPRCARPFEAAAFTPRPKPVHVAQVAEAGPGGAAPCGAHPANATVRSCGRCGVFMCALCEMEDVAEQPLCPACFDRLFAEDGLPRLRLAFRNHRGMATMSLLAGFLLWPGAPAFGAAAVYTGILSLRQRRQQHQAGAVGDWVIIVLGVLQSLAGIAALAFLFSVMGRDK